MIEYEIHVICQCTKFQMSRNQMIQVIAEKKINMNKTNKDLFIDILTSSDTDIMKSKKISNDQELIQSDPISCPQNQKGNVGLFVYTCNIS